jgi:hypothetical protein
MDLSPFFVSTMERTAEFSPCGHYRYSLGRRWGRGHLVAWIMLNPSTADAYKEDPTIRRVISFSQAFGAGQARIVNLFALKATRPQVLYRHTDPVGPRNADSIRAAVRAAAYVVCAWGANSVHPEDEKALVILKQEAKAAYCLGLTKHGRPRHPLYVPGKTQRLPFSLPIA